MMIIFLLLFFVVIVTHTIVNVVVVVVICSGGVVLLYNCCFTFIVLSKLFASVSDLIDVPGVNTHIYICSNLNRKYHCGSRSIFQL